MNAERLDIAIEEAERFLKKAKALRATGKGFGLYGQYNPIERGHARRASMDLTRALAALRRVPS